MAYDNLDIDYGAGNGARATSDDALPGDWPLDLLSELANSSDYESLRQEDIEHLLLGTTDPNAEESIIERESTISFVSHPDEMECDVPASNQDIDMEPYDDFQLVTTQASTAHVSDLNEPQPPHSNLSLNPPSGLQDAGAQTGMGMWADSLPIINVQPPRAMPDLGHQEVYQAVYQAGPQTDTIAAYQYGHDTIAAPAKYATDNMQSIPFLWAEAGTRPYNPNPDFQSDMMLDHADIKSPYPEPWNNLDRGETHNAYTTQPSCGCPGTSSHVPHASSRSVSTLPWTGTSASTSSSAQLDLSDSMMTVRPPDSYQRLPQCPHGNPITYFLPESEHGAAHETPATFAQLGRQQSYTGEDASSRRGGLAILFMTDTASGASSPISTPSYVPDVLPCTHSGCRSTFKGKYRRGTLQRHARMKHGQKGKEERIYPCGMNRCQKTFCRQDSRLKHYRKHHPELNLPDPVTRPRGSSMVSYNHNARNA